MKELIKPIEEWKKIQQYEGLYEISSHGRVRSLNRIVMRNDIKIKRKGKILKHSYPNGYPFVRLWKNGKRKAFKVHVLVAKAFLRKDSGKTEVNHIDGVTNNNDVDNLEWVTHSENMKHAYATGLNKYIGSLHHKSKLTESDIPEIRELIKKGLSMEKIGNIYNVSHQAIREIKNGKGWHYIPINLVSLKGERM